MPVKPHFKRRSLRQFCLVHGHIYSYRKVDDYFLYECSYAVKHGILKYQLKPRYRRLITLKRIFGDENQRFGYSKQQRQALL